MPAGNSTGWRRGDKTTRSRAKGILLFVRVRWIDYNTRTRGPPLYPGLFILIRWYRDQLDAATIVA